MSATPAAAERVDELRKVGNGAGAPVELGNQYGADLAAVNGAHDPLPPWPVEILSGGARVNYHVDQLVIVQRGERFQLDPLRRDAKAGVCLLFGADPDVSDCLAGGVGGALGSHAFNLLPRRPTCQSSERTIDKW